MVRRTALRASDADREYVAERLRNAAVEGRLSAQELEHRLEGAFAARTYGDLSALIADLPREQHPDRRLPRIPLRLRPASVVALVLLFPIALAVAAAVIVAIAALFTAWVVAVTLAAVFLGPRARHLRHGPWAIGYRAWYSHRGGRGEDRRIAGGFSRWQ